MSDQTVTRTMPEVLSQAQPFAPLVRTAALLLIVTLPLIVIPWGQDAYSRPKALVLYGLTAIMLVGWFLCWLINREMPWTKTLPELALWLFAFSTLLSSAVSVNARLTIFGAPGRHEGILAAASYVTLYFVGANFFGSGGGLRRLTLGMSTIAAIVVIYGLVQPFVSPLFAGEEFLRNWYGTLGILRIPSTVGGPIVFGGYLASMLPLLIGLAASERGRTRFAWLAVACLSVVALTLTLTRAAWAAAAVALGIFTITAARRVKPARRLELLAVPVAIALSVVVFVALVGTVGDLESRVTTGLSTESGSLASRLYIWEETTRLIRQRPWLGWGLETLREVFPYDRESLVRYFGIRPVIIDRAHNEFLHMAVSVGLPGAAAYMLFWALVVAAAIRTLRRVQGPDQVLACGWLAAIVGYVVQLQFSFSAVALAPLLWLLTGSAAGWEGQSRDGG